MKNSVFIISGPLGIGKSTTTRELVKRNENTVLLEGDVFFLALEGIDSIDWDLRLRISWNNIVAITREYLDNDLNVIIDSL